MGFGPATFRPTACPPQYFSTRHNTVHFALTLWNPTLFTAVFRTQICAQKRPPPVSILGQPNPLHKPTSYLLEIHPNIIHPSTPRSPQWSLSLRFPTKTLYTPSPHPYVPHAQPISFFSILSPAQYWVRNDNLVLHVINTYSRHGAESVLIT